MPKLLYIGLFIALASAPLLLMLFKLLRLNPLSLVPRLSFWIAATGVIVIVASNIDAGFSLIGLVRLTWKDIALALAATLIILVMLGAYLSVQRKLGKGTPEEFQQFMDIATLSTSYKWFLVMTAAIVEEVLYRGYAIGVGQLLIGDIWVANIVSIAAFTIAHLRWNVAHLIPVFVSSIVLSFLFMLTNSLWACIIAHFIIDAFGFIFVPSVIKLREQARLKSE